MAAHPAPRRILTAAASLLLVVSIPAFAVEPTLDASFGPGGWARTDLSPGHQDEPYDILIQPDGKIVTAGISMLGWDYYLSLTRHLDDGSPDPSFDGDGKVMVHWVVRDQANAIALQSDGKIVVVGKQAISSAGSAIMPSIYRFNADGSVDSLFETNGMMAGRFTPNSSGEMGGVFVLPDDRILAAGVSTTNANGGTPGFAFLRRLANGGADTSYGSGGMAFIDLTGPIGGISYQRPGVDFAPDGAGIIASTFWDNVDWRAEFVVVRVDADGDVIPFGASGTLRPNIAIFDEAVRVVLLGNGDFLIGATTPRDPFFGNFTVFKFFANGALDGDFGTNGRTDVQLSTNHNKLIGMTLAPDGKIVLVGNDGNSNGGLARLTADGDPDATFGTNGSIIIDVSLFAGSGWFTSPEYDSFQRLLVAGFDYSSNSGDFAVARFAAVPTGVHDTPSTPGFALRNVYPNPSSGTATLAFDLGQDARATLEIFDVRGRRVAVLADSPRAAGRHDVTWSGRGDGGREVASGVYFARFTARDASGRVLHRSSSRILRLR